MIIEKIKDWITSFGKYKTYDLGKLQRVGFISELPHMSACPNCVSKNIKWKFPIPTDGSKPSLDCESICKDCGYGDKSFELTNMAIKREEKINGILKVSNKLEDKSWEVSGQWQVEDLREYVRWKRSISRIKKIMRMYGKKE